MLRVIAEDIDADYDRRHQYDTVLLRVVDYRGHKIAIYRTFRGTFTTMNDADKIYFDKKKSVSSEDKAVSIAKKDIDNFLTKKGESMQRLNDAIAEAASLLEAELKDSDCAWLFARMARKESEWRDVDREIIDLGKASAGVLDFLRGLKKLVFRDAFVNVEDAASNALSQLKSGMEQWFILDDGSKQYIVDTEGFTYARYIGRIIGLNKL